MENNGIEIGDIVILLDGPKDPGEWSAIPGEHIVHDIQHTRGRPYIYIQSSAFIENGVGTPAFDVRRAVKVEGLTPLERAIYT